MVTSDFRLEVEIWPFRACAMHPVIIIGTVRLLWTWLWGRYHVPQNVFLVFNNIEHRAVSLRQLSFLLCCARHCGVSVIERRPWQMRLSDRLVDRLIDCLAGADQGLGDGVGRRGCLLPS